MAFVGLVAAQAAAAAEQPAALRITQVGRLPFPERGYIIDLPKGADLAHKRVHVSENGLGVGNFTLNALSASGVKYGAILAIDASDSMAGKPEAAAIAAARSFIDKRSTGQEVGIITFNNGVTVLHEPTSDSGALRAAVAKQPSLAYGTHIY